MQFNSGKTNLYRKKDIIYESSRLLYLWAVRQAGSHIGENRPVLRQTEYIEAVFYQRIRCQILLGRRFGAVAADIVTEISGIFSGRYTEHGGGRFGLSHAPKFSAVTAETGERPDGANADGGESH
jgi:hypothetical protein